MLLQQKRNNRFLIILFLSILLHCSIFLLFKTNLNLDSNLNKTIESKIEIDLSNYNFSSNENFFKSQKPEAIVKKPQIKENIPDFKKVLKIENTFNNEIPDISTLTKIPSNIPLKFPIKKKKSNRNTLPKFSKSGDITKTKKTHTGNFNSKKIIMAYLKNITEIIKKNTIYPLIARKQELEGKVIVEVKLLKNGKIKKIKIVRSSNFKILDKSAIKSIRKSEPFPPFPDKLNEPFLILRIPVEFKLEHSD